MSDVDSAVMKALMFDCIFLSVKRKTQNFLFEVLTVFLLPVRQYADICLFSTAQYKCPVAQLEAE